MGPVSLRRYRAERLLRDEFEALRPTVIGAVRARLRGHRVSIDESDLESCYSIAWQGLYTALLSGEEIHNPTGWLVLVTYRRAIDEQRTRRAEAELRADAAAQDRDLSAEMDDRTKLHQLVEGIGSRLSERERQAAALCYLLGLSRAEAASRMGIGQRRMKKLMEGRGARQPGVASKVGALTEAISAGRFCEEQASLMRAFAFGVLDPEGDRHKIALSHQRTCPACRAYVRSLRRLSALLPPVFLPRLLSGLRLGGGSGATAGAGAGTVGNPTAATGGAGGPAAATGGVGGPAAATGGVGGPAAATGGAGGPAAATGGAGGPAAATGGPTVTAGSPVAGVGGRLAGVGGVKVAAVGALLVGAVAGTAALTGASSPTRSHPPSRRPAVVSAPPPRGEPHRGSLPSKARSGARFAPSPPPASAKRGRGHAPQHARQAPLPSAAWREFGIERQRSATGRSRAIAPAQATTARAPASPPRPPSSAGAAHAQREFGIE